MTPPNTTVHEFLARFRTPDGRLPTRWYWIGAVILIVSLITILTGTFWSIVTLIGLGALVVGVVATVRGSANFFRVRTRSAGRALLAAGVVVLLVGSAAHAATSPQSAITDASDTKPAATSEASHAPTPRHTPTPTPTPVQTESEVQESAAIPFETATVNDGAIDVGTSAVTSVGQAGTLTTTYLVKYVDGVEVSRSLSSEEVTLAPVAEVTAIGTRQPEPAPVPAPVQPAPATGCDSNYADVCVPIASDVDCAGGSGNGPAYIDGPLRIVGTDIYDLDRDGDGIACDA